MSSINIFRCLSNLKISIHRRYLPHCNSIHHCLQSLLAKDPSPVLRPVQQLFPERHSSGGGQRALDKDRRLRRATSLLIQGRYYDIMLRFGFDVL